MTTEEFKQQVALALAQNMEWMPKLESTEEVFQYLGVDPPATPAETVCLGQQFIATMIAETAHKIVNAVELYET